MKRLKNAHFGQWVDPSKTIQFTFEGKLIQGLKATLSPQCSWPTSNGSSHGRLSTTVREGH